MRKYILYVLSFVVCCCMAGCLEDFHKDETKNISYRVTVRLTAPEELPGESFEGERLTLASKDRGVSYSAVVGAGNTAVLEVEMGTYTVACNKSVTVGGKETMLVGGLKDDVAEFSVTEDTAVEVDFVMTYHMGELVIKEIFFNSHLGHNGNAYPYDQYVILYNNTDQMMYLDNYGVAMSAETSISSNNPPTSNWYPVMDAGKTPLGTCFIFPTNETGTRCPLAPGEEAVLAYAATDHSLLGEDFIDLGKPGYYAMYNSVLTVQKVPDTERGVVVMDMLFRSGTATLLTMNTTQPTFAVVKFEGVSPGEYILQDGVQMQKPGALSPTSAFFFLVNKEWVVDAVEFRTNSSPAFMRFQKEINSGLNGQYTVDAAANSGIVFRRKVKEIVGGRVVYQDTNNTANDFEIVPRSSLLEEL